MVVHRRMSSRRASPATRRFFLATVLAATFPVEADAAPESVMPWLLFSMGARASGMGGAQITEATGADRLFWNPALLGFQDRLSGDAMYFQPVPDLTDDVHFAYFAGAFAPEGLGGFGANLMYLTYGDSEFTDASGIRLGSFTSWEMAAGVGWGIALRENLSGGVGFKYLRSELAPEIAGLEEGSDWTVALDFGIHIRRILGGLAGENVFPNGFRWGLAILNMGPSMKFVKNGSPNPLPLNFRTGLGLDVYQDEFLRGTLAVDMNKVLVRQRGGTGTEDFSVDPAWKALFTAWGDESLEEELNDAIYNFGAELALLEGIFVRWGIVRDRTGDIMPKTFREELRPDGGGINFGAILRELGTDFPHDASIELGLFPQATGLDETWRWSVSADLVF